MATNLEQSIQNSFIKFLLATLAGKLPYMKEVSLLIRTSVVDTGHPSFRDDWDRARVIDDLIDFIAGDIGEDETLESIASEQENHDIFGVLACALDHETPLGSLRFICKVVGNTLNTEVRFRDFPNALSIRFACDQRRFNNAHIVEVLVSRYCAALIGTLFNVDGVTNVSAETTGRVLTFDVTRLTIRP